MINETIALEMYNDHEVIKRPESFDEYKDRILHGFQIAKDRSANNKITRFTDKERKDYNLALKYNLVLINSLLKEDCINTI